MDISNVQYIFQTYMTTGLVILFPFLVITFIAAIIIGVFQAMSQIQEQTLSFAPKLIIIFLIVSLCGSIMFEKIVQMIQETLRMSSSLF
ncbi:flagellar biosynthetic protein FliQ [Bacillus toyonensis]|uniref:flagellar biosynthetic protein FliQ n=1 Tax=Bacillus toyonensis TaxID=155322 RepID=UPI002E1B523F|nr:flagellar biosynthetic protein FliQ [Bacillus toyonensis]